MKELLVQMHRCKRACRKNNWLGAIEAALLIGESDGYLQRLRKQYRPAKNAATKTANGKSEQRRSKMPEIISKAVEIYRREMAANGFVKDETIWKAIEKLMRAGNLEKYGRSTILEAWRPIKYTEEHGE